jgi:hypothetical protein
MAQLNSGDPVREQCSTCDEERAHEVAIELLVESETEENQKFSREPYRIAECHVCGATTKLRLNNA